LISGIAGRAGNAVEKARKGGCKVVRHGLKAKESANGPQGYAKATGLAVRSHEKAEIAEASEGR
jgi:hypothetical protein